MEQPKERAMKSRPGSVWVFCVAGIAVGGGAGCRKRGGPDDYSNQIGSAMGEVMASLDESVAGGSETAMLPRLPPVLRAPDELKGPLWRRALDEIIPSAYAASCWPSTFSACNAGVRTRDFADCNIGQATLSGSVTLTFTRTAACVLLTDQDAVTRTADFTLTGLYGGTLAVTSPGGGQTVTRTTNGFQYSVGGMQRVLTGPGGRTWFDVRTRTTAPIVVTGGTRTDLVIASGMLEVDHHVAGYTVTLAPSNLTWNASCNCAVSGSLTGTVAGGPFDGEATTVTMTGCGHADVTIGDETESITLDRCGAI
jgi:hypothetical protein